MSRHLTEPQRTNEVTADIVLIEAIIYFTQECGVHEIITATLSSLPSLSDAQRIRRLIRRMTARIYIYLGVVVVLRRRMCFIPKASDL